MLTYVNSFTFSPRRVEALLSMRALALNSQVEKYVSLRETLPWIDSTYSVPQSLHRLKLASKLILNVHQRFAVLRALLHVFLNAL